MNITKSATFIVKGSLFEIVQISCFQINSDNKYQSDEVLILTIKSLTWTIQMMQAYPNQ